MVSWHLMPGSFDPESDDGLDDAGLDHHSPRRDAANFNPPMRLPGRRSLEGR